MTDGTRSNSTREQTIAWHRPKRNLDIPQVRKTHRVRSKLFRDRDNQRAQAFGGDEVRPALSLTRRRKMANWTTESNDSYPSRVRAKNRTKTTQYIRASCRARKKYHTRHGRNIAAGKKRHDTDNRMHTTNVGDTDGNASKLI